MHPSIHARSMPTKPALIFPDRDETIDYATLEAQANQSAHALRTLGLKRGDVVAALFENGPEVFVLALAAQRTGLYLTSISNKLGSAEIAYILDDCDASLVVTSDRYLDLASEANGSAPRIVVAWSRETASTRSWSEQIADQPAGPVSDESAGTDLLYSSGTTGRPKGVKFALPGGPIDEETPMMAMGRSLYGMDERTVYLSTSPLYHAAPLRWALVVLRQGGTVVVMERFDAERALALIERHAVTHATFVPTHFVRLLKLPEAARSVHDVSSLRFAIHAAAPCPVPVKRAMMEWWGPILYEYYAGTETCGITAIDPEEWMRRPGSVGRAVLGTLHITTDDGATVGAREIGNVAFGDGPQFEYHKDPEKTAQAYDRNGYASLGDIGWVDEEGYLFLTDRKSFMIISGGVNIYPQEIENCLIVHPKVAEVAVIGVPHDEMGECVVAVVQPAAGIQGDAALARELEEFTRKQLGGIKTPRRFEFRTTLPREPTGKLMKRLLFDEFRQAS